MRSAYFFMPYLFTFLTTVVVIVLLIPLATRLRLLDFPGEHRKHTTATPSVGGIAMFAGSVVGAVWTSAGTSLTLPLLVSGGVMLAIGIWDDRHQTTYFFRFVGQLIAAAIMVKAGGIVLDDLGQLTSQHLVPLNRWSVALTLFATVGVINAWNMSDGMDGLAGSLTLVTTASLIVVSIVADSGQAAKVLAVVACAVVAFLLFNARILGRSSARVFMGDAGSMWLGLTLAWFLIALSQGEARAMAPVTALWITAVPLIDAVGSLLRRAVRGRSPFLADQAHYHHYLLALGFSVNQTLLIAVGCALMCAATGLAAWYAGVPEHVMFFLFLGLFGIYLVTMGWAERRIASRGIARHEKKPR